MESIKLEEQPEDVEKFDLIIVTTALSETEMTTVTRNICQYLQLNGSLLVVHRDIGHPTFLQQRAFIFHIPASTTGQFPELP